MLMHDIECRKAIGYAVWRQLFTTLLNSRPWTAWFLRKFTRCPARARPPRRSPRAEIDAPQLLAAEHLGRFARQAPVPIRLAVLAPRGPTGGTLAASRLPPT